MKRPEPDSPEAEARSAAAAEWLVKRDRALGASEQDEFLQWLASDPRHGEWFALHRHLVGDFNCLAQWRPEHSDEPNPDLLARPPRRVRWLVPVALAVAASVAVSVTLWRPWETRATPDAAVSAAVAAAGGYERRILEDGSTVELNRGAVVAVKFTPGERHITLSRGEALFTVAPDPARPFIVHAGGVDVRAVGTAFNVRLDSAAVEVLVTYGRVAVGQPPATPTAFTSLAATPAATRTSPEVVAGQRATISRKDPAAPKVEAVTAEEAARALAWQVQLLDFAAVPLERAIAEFNRRNRVQFRLADDRLAQLPIVASIRSDNVEGFAKFLERAPDVEVERRDGEIVLRRKP